MKGGGIENSSFLFVAFLDTLLQNLFESSAGAFLHFTRFYACIDKKDRNMKNVYANVLLDV